MAYVGYHDSDDKTVQKQAEDMFGNRISMWWVYKDGAWVSYDE